MTSAPLDGLLERAGGIRRLIYSRLPVTVCAVTAAVSWSRFLMQNHLYDTDQAELLAVARLAMAGRSFRSPPH